MLNPTLILAAIEEGDPGLVGKVSDIATGLSTHFQVQWWYFLAQVFNFLVIIFVLYRFAFKPVLATMDERNKKIAEGLQYADNMKAKLAQTEKEQAEILRQASLEGKKIIAEARDSGKALVEKAAQDATRTAEDIIKKGHEANKLERQQLLAELRSQVAQLVVATTNRVLGRDLSPEERSRFAATAAEDLSKN